MKYFDPYIPVNKKTIKASKRALKENKQIILDIKQAIENIDNIKLEDKSFVSKKNGDLLGLINQEYTLSTTMLFAETSGIADPLLKSKDLIGSIHSINWTCNYPERKTIKEAAKSLLAGIKEFSDNHKLSVIIAHHHNINVISQF